MSEGRNGAGEWGKKEVIVTLRCNCFFYKAILVRGFSCILWKVLSIICTCVLSLDTMFSLLVAVGFLILTLPILSISSPSLFFPPRIGEHLVPPRDFSFCAVIFQSFWCSGEACMRNCFTDCQQVLMLARTGNSSQC